MNENSLGFSTRLAQCIFDLHCQLWEIDGAICSIDDHTVVSREVQPYNSSRQVLHHDEMFCKDVISNVNFKCGCCYCFI